MTSLSNADVDALIIDLQYDGDTRKRAVTQLYIAFAQKVTQFLKLRGVPSHEAEDVLHDIFISLIARADKFTAMGQGRGWVWSVVRSKLADRYRSSDKATEYVDGNDAVFDAGHYENDSYDESRLQACIEGQMSAFSRDHPDGAQALSWVMDDELDLRAVSELLGRSYGATREFMSQVKRKLRVYIEKCLTS